MKCMNKQFQAKIISDKKRGNMILNLKATRGNFSYGIEITKTKAFDSPKKLLQSFAENTALYLTVLGRKRYNEAEKTCFIRDSFTDEEFAKICDIRYLKEKKPYEIHFEEVMV